MRKKVRVGETGYFGTRRCRVLPFPRSETLPARVVGPGANTVIEFEDDGTRAVVPRRAVRRGAYDLVIREGDLIG